LFVIGNGNAGDTHTNKFKYLNIFNPGAPYGGGSSC
jgi:hypothetical protein